jgi:hypothetical protein
MAYDPEIGKLVLFGGGGIASAGIRDYFTDTWAYDGVTWSQQHPATSPPPRVAGSLDGSMAYDPAMGKLVVYAANETWTYNGTTWAKESPAVSPVSGAGPITYDANLKKLVKYTTGMYGDDRITWTYDGTSWTGQLIPTSPLVLGFWSMAYGNNSGGPGNETWTYDGNTWTEQLPATAPTAREDALMVYDDALNSLVLFGGYGQASLGGSYVDLSDTWTYGPPTSGSR